MEKATNEFVKVSSAGLEKLVKDIIQLKQYLSKVLTANNVLMLYKKIHALEQEVSRLRQELKLQANNQFILRRRHSDNLVDVEKLRKENFELRTQLNVLQEEKSEQYEEYLSCVTICLTVIWHASLRDVCVESMIARETIVDFLEFVSECLGSFSEGNKPRETPIGEWVRKDFDCDSQEYKLVMTLAGIITNIAATPLGRDYLSSKEHGIKALDALVAYLTETPVHKCPTPKSLVLKALINISINKTGLKYITSKKDLMTSLARLLKDETDVSLRVSCINCILSIITEPDNLTLVQQFIEVVSVRKLKELSDVSRGELKKVSLELICDIREVLYRQSQA